MKKIALFALILGTAGFASAQITTPTTDVLGAHLNYGRGCAACHAPHSGAYGNGAAKTTDAGAGTNALWGEDVGSLYGATLTFGQTFRNGTASSYTEVLPANLGVNDPNVLGTLTCLSCHDGNLAAGAMMKNKVYETLPSTYGTQNSVPTLLDNGPYASNYANDHPVGTNAVMGCGGQYNWDCTISSTGAVLMTGPNSSKFVTNYGFFVSPGVINGTTPIVVCTTCHNQHLMNVVNVTNGACTSKNGVVTSCSGASGLPSGTYATMFFIRAPYNPASTTPGSNQTAQFCRQCHGGEANESNNSTAVTTF